MGKIIKTTWVHAIMFGQVLNDMHKKFSELKEYKMRRDALSKNNSRATGVFRFFNIMKKALRSEPNNRIVSK